MMFYEENMVYALDSPYTSENRAVPCYIWRLTQAWAYIKQVKDAYPVPQRVARARVRVATPGEIFMWRLDPSVRARIEPTS